MYKNWIFSFYDKILHKKKLEYEIKQDVLLAYYSGDANCCFVLSEKYNYPYSIVRKHTQEFIDRGFVDFREASFSHGKKDDGLVCINSIGIYHANDEIYKSEYQRYRSKIIRSNVNTIAKATNAIIIIAISALSLYLSFRLDEKERAIDRLKEEIHFLKKRINYLQK